jgi:nitronate monooxygenase
VNERRVPAALAGTVGRIGGDPRVAVPSGHRKGFRPTSYRADSTSNAGATGPGRSAAARRRAQGKAPGALGRSGSTMQQVRKGSMNCPRLQTCAASTARLKGRNQRTGSIMWPDQRLRDLLGVEHPIVQAPMMGSCTPSLASAVANAGGLGSLGCGEKPADMVRREAEAIRARTNRSFNLNFFIIGKQRTDPAVLDAARDRLKPWYDDLGLGDPPSELPDPGPGFDEARLELVLSLKPKVVSFHFGHPPPPFVEAMKDAGIVLLSSATNVAEARALETAGMDAIIAQGWEAGGHRGSHAPTAPLDGVGTMALVPQVVDAVSVPVIAAGGIGDGRGIAAALALGAAGVQMGTAFLTCPEAATEPARRERLRHATDRDTLVTDAFSGRSARAMRSRYAEEMERNRQRLPQFPQMYALSGPIREAADDGDASFLLYGQSAGLNREMAAADLVERLVRETREVIDGLASR